VLVHQRAAHHSLRYSQSKLGHQHSANSAYVGYGMDQTTAPLRRWSRSIRDRPQVAADRPPCPRHSRPGCGRIERFLEGLVEWACQPPRVYTHRWAAGDVVLWDNRCLLHRAMPWDLAQPRVMWHSRLSGDPVAEAALPQASATPA